MIVGNSWLRLSVATAVAAGAVAAQAVTFSNVIIQSPPLSNGSSFSTLGNAISFFTPNAIVGDTTHPLRSGTLNIQYDAASGPAMFADEVVVNLGAVALGSGVIVFLEQVFELDSNGNEVGGPIGTASHTFDANSNPIWSTTINFTHQVENLRVKKSFTLAAPDTQATDLAAVAIVNQNIHVVPEPATLGALGVGMAALIARRRKNRR